MKKTLLACILFSSLLCAKPPREIPKDLYARYTMNGRIPVRPYYLDNTVSDTHYFYSKEQVDLYIDKARRKEKAYYGVTDTWLYSIMDKYPDFWKGKTVAIMGSVKPWYESVVLSYGAYPYTIEYNKIGSNDERLTIVTVEEFKKNPRKFDVILSISSFEHDGLGRYGDPLDPDGDLRAMKECREMLAPDGVMLLSVPVGPDCLAWNAHRIYGPLRLGQLLKGWQVIQSEGFSFNLYKMRLTNFVQPVFLLHAVQDA